MLDRCIGSFGKVLDVFAFELKIKIDLLGLLDDGLF